MKKEPLIPTPRTPRQTGWLDHVLDDSDRAVVPKGPRFQADVPDWTPEIKEETLRNYEKDPLRWMGTNVWKPKNSNQVDKNEDATGKGRPDICSCEIPGSVQCTDLHLKEKIKKLQRELGPAFWKWKLNEMGEEASNLWTSGEQKAFESIVKANPISEGKSFLKPAVESLRSQSRQSIVNYYFNAYLPSRMSTQIKSGCKTVDTDDEEEPVEIPKSKVSRKRSEADIATSNSSSGAKKCYMTGKR